MIQPNPHFLYVGQVFDQWRQGDMIDVTLAGCHVFMILRVQFPEFHVDAGQEGYRIGYLAPWGIGFSYVPDVSVLSIKRDAPMT
jgi:hypothetical protein